MGQSRSDRCSNRGGYRRRSRQHARRQHHVTAWHGDWSGLARAVEKPIPGVNAFSAPVFDHTGSIALAVTAIGPSHMFDANWDGPIADELRNCAATASTRLGFPSKPKAA